MKPFVNISASRGNVTFNFHGDSIDQLEVYAAGYHTAAKELAEKFSERHYPDYEGYPVLFLYRHSLELFLKAVVWRGAQLLGLTEQEPLNHPKLFGNHGLSRLLPAVKVIFKAMGWKFEDSTIGSWESFEHFVMEVEQIDPQSYAFRYPIDNKEEALMEQHLTVNVPIYAKQMDDILGYLEGAAGLLGENLQHTAEAQHEMRQWIEENWEQ